MSRFADSYSTLRVIKEKGCAAAAEWAAIGSSGRVCLSCILLRDSLRHTVCARLGETASWTVSILIKKTVLFVRHANENECNSSSEHRRGCIVFTLLTRSINFFISKGSYFSRSCYWQCWSDLQKIRFRFGVSLVFPCRFTRKYADDNLFYVVLLILKFHISNYPVEIKFDKQCISQKGMHKEFIGHKQYEKDIPSSGLHRCSFQYCLG